MKRLIFLLSLVLLCSSCTNNTDKLDSDYTLHSNPDSLYHYAVDSILRADIENKDYDKARRMLEQAIDSGHVESMSYLGADLLYGWSFGHDEGKGVAYLRKAAEMQSTSAMSYLASGYFNKSNIDASIFYLRKCSDLNDDWCTYNLGYLFTHGNLPIGTGKSHPDKINFKEGLHYLKKAAANNQSDAQVALAYWYIHGVEGHLQPDTARARELLLKAQEDAENLGIVDEAQVLLDKIQ